MGPLIALDPLHRNILLAIRALGHRTLPDPNAGRAVSEILAAYKLIAIAVTTGRPGQRILVLLVWAV